MRLHLVSSVLAIALASCTTQNMADVVAYDSGVGTANDTSLGLPCDVDSMLARDCRSCHAATPIDNAPMSLATYADLMADAKTKPSVRVADLCLTRMNDVASPMPPAPASIPAADIATFQAWLDAGAPSGTCVATTGNDPLDASPTCTTGSTWNNGNDGSSRMNPGKACIACHSQGEGPRFAIAGTVYATGHEPDLCDGASGAAEVVITDANGVVTTLKPNSAGNFYSSSHATIATPFHAVVTYNGKTRAMSAAQTSGDCNSCHTQSGTNGAPGRITLPF